MDLNVQEARENNDLKKQSYGHGTHAIYCPMDRKIFWPRAIIRITLVLTCAVYRLQPKAGPNVWCLAFNIPHAPQMSQKQLSPSLKSTLEMDPQSHNGHIGPIYKLQTFHLPKNTVKLKWGAQINVVKTELYYSGLKIFHSVKNSWTPFELVFQIHWPFSSISTAERAPEISKVDFQIEDLVKIQYLLQRLNVFLDFGTLFSMLKSVLILLHFLQVSGRAAHLIGWVCLSLSFLASFQIIWIFKHLISSWSQSHTRTLIIIQLQRACHITWKDQGSLSCIVFYFLLAPSHWKALIKYYFVQST